MATSDQISKYLLCTILRIILDMCFSEFDEKTFSGMNTVQYSRRGNGIINRRASSVQFSRSVVSNSLRPHESQHARPPSITISQSSLRLMSIESVMPSSHLILCRPLLLLPPILPSIRVFPMSQLFP